MEKDFVKHSEALSLKELGFDEPCLAFYNHNAQLNKYMNPDKDWNSMFSQSLKNSNITIPDTFTAPTYSQAFRWFRGEHNMKFYTREDMWNDWCTLYICVGGSDPKYIDYGEFKYEEVELSCLKKLIEIIKKKN